MLMDFRTYRKYDIDAKLRQLGYRPIDIMVTGSTGAGKSTTLNSFFQKVVATVGDGVDPETMYLDGYTLNDFLRLWDTPGLGDSSGNSDFDLDKFHANRIRRLLRRTHEKRYGFIDMVLVIVEGSNRDMKSTFDLLNQVIVPSIQGDRILVAINQADMAMKSHIHWNHGTNTPDMKLKEFLEEKSYSIQRRVRESTGVSIPKPVYYSAEYGYHVDVLFDFIIDHIPTQRRVIR